MAGRCVVVCGGGRGVTLYSLMSITRNVSMTAPFLLDSSSMMRRLSSVKARYTWVGRLLTCMHTSLLHAPPTPLSVRTSIQLSISLDILTILLSWSHYLVSLYAHLHPVVDPEGMDPSRIHEPRAFDHNLDQVCKTQWCARYEYDQV